MYREMNLDEFKNYVKRPEITDQILVMRSGTAKKKVNGKTSFICPICGHGKNGDGLTHIPEAPELLNCFGKCGGKKGDIIEFFRIADNVEFIDEIKILAELLGITIKSNKNQSNETKAQGKIMNNTIQAAPVKYNEAADYTDYYQECFSRIQREGENEKALSYLKSRGIDINTALSYGIGYDPAADPANAPGAKEGQGKPHPAARLIVPCDSGFYATRAIEEKNVDKRYWKMNAKGQSGSQKVKHLLMPEWIYSADFIFICEGIFDALSISQVGDGAAAIALNSANYAGEVIEAFEKKRPSGLILLALDNDKAGAIAAEKIAAGLNNLNIPYARADICGGYKDPNEALIKNPAALSAAIKEAKEKHTRPDGIAAYLNGGGYARDIENIIPPISTKFAQLDYKSGGGIKTELYVISAPSSTGKTTFCLQLACNLAGSGRNVLYFAMEQSRLELVNKCIARESCGINRDKAITAQEAANPEVWQEETAKKAREALAAKVGNRLSIIEWNLDATTEALKKYILAYIERNQNSAPPVVFIDYLQLIQGIEINGRPQQIREVINDTISEMKRISRAYNIPIICISSQARNTYEKGFSMGNTKESGNIEYTAGVVWGLQFTEIEKGTSGADLRKLKTETPRKMTLTCDKDRGNIAFYQVHFDYYSKYDYFIESANQRQ